jgi:hypothetical protein
LKKRLTSGDHHDPGLAELRDDLGGWHPAHLCA